MSEIHEFAKQTVAVSAECKLAASMLQSGDAKGLHDLYMNLLVDYVGISEAHRLLCKSKLGKDCRASEQIASMERMSMAVVDLAKTIIESSRQ